MPAVEFKGTVFSGKGHGKKFIDLPWVKLQIEEKLGFTPYPGTLNIHLDKESIENKILIKNFNGINVEPQVGYCPGLMFKAFIDSLAAGIIIPRISNYPNDVLEIIAPVYLREHLLIVDGSIVTLSVIAEKHASY